MKNVLLTILIFCCRPAYTQDTTNKYGLYIINSVEKLKQTIATDSNKAFVYIKEFVPDVLLDIKYATTQNVFYKKLYKKPYAITRLPVAKALAKVQSDLKRHGVGIKIYDAYRPYHVTCRMWDLLPDSIYMGNPKKGSKHNRGIALDLTLINLKTREELKMPTPFDALVYASHPNFMGLPDSVIRNRQLLIDVMNRHGFSVDPVEWWHFNYRDAVDYELLDIDAAEISAIIKKQKT
jgi:zinc D-Ala-D-Ala dipeptidase